MNNKSKPKIVSTRGHSQAPKGKGSSKKEKFLSWVKIPSFRQTKLQSPKTKIKSFEELPLKGVRRIPADYQTSKDPRKSVFKHGLIGLFSKIKTLRIPPIKVIPFPKRGLLMVADKF